MKIEDLCKLLGKNRLEIEEMLENNDVIELNLSERKPKSSREEDDLKIYE